MFESLKNLLLSLTLTDADQVSGNLLGAVSYMHEYLYELPYREEYTTNALYDEELRKKIKEIVSLVNNETISLKLFTELLVFTQIGYHI